MYWRELFEPRDCDQYTKPLAKADAACKALLGDVRMHAFRGARVLLGFAVTQDTLLTIHVGRSSTTRRGAWGRYYNFLVAYTPPEHRLKGFARAALAHALDFPHPLHAIAPDRIKSLAGSKAGILLHMSLGHQFWGVNDKDELIVDTPLRTGSRPGVPFHGRSATAHRLHAEQEGMTPDIHEAALNTVKPMTGHELAMFYRLKYSENLPEQVLNKFMTRGVT